MSFDDFADFKADEPDTLEPTVGTHTAALVHGSVNKDRDTGRAKWVILEWQTTDLAFYWKSFHGVTGGAKFHTKRALDGLGVDLAGMGMRNGTYAGPDAAWDDVAGALTSLEGAAFVVQVTKPGKWLNTAIVDRPGAIQGELPVAVPASPPAAGVFDDDDVPF